MRHLNISAIYKDFGEEDRYSTEDEREREGDRMVERDRGIMI